MFQKLKNSLNDYKETIKGYEIDGDTIIVKYSFFRKKVVKNTKENIQILNEILREQQSKTDINKITERRVRFGKKVIKWAAISLGLFALEFFTHLPLFVALTNISLLVNTYNSIRYLSNFYKEEKYNRVEELLNSEIPTSTKNEEEPKEEKGKEVEPVKKETVKKTETFDLSNMSLEALKKLRSKLDEIITREETVNLDGPVLEKK